MSLPRMPESAFDQLRRQGIGPIGWGFLLAWVFCTFYTQIAASSLEGISLGFGALPIARDTLGFAPVAFAVGALAALIALERRMGLSLAGSRTALACALGCALGTPLLFVAAPGGATSFLYPIAAALTGMGSAVLWIAWGGRYARLPQDAVEAATLASALIAALLILGSSAMGGWVQTAFIASLPCVSALLLALPSPDDGHATELSVNTGTTPVHAPREINPAPAHDPLRSLTGSGAGILLACLFVCVLGSFWTDDPLDRLPLQASIVACGALMLGVTLYSISGPRRLTVAYLYRWMSPLLVLGFSGMALLGFAAGSYLAFAISLAARFTFCVITQMYFAQFVARLKATPTQAYGWGWIFVHLGDFLGVLSIGAFGLAQREGLLSLEQVTALCTVILVAATMAVSSRDPLFRPQRGEASPDTGSDLEPAAYPVSGARTLSGSEAEGQLGDAPTSDPRSARIAELAERFALTPRETEIFALLMAGRSVPYIRDELIISKDTVATHVKHIYAKAGVHTRQELIDLL